MCVVKFWTVINVRNVCALWNFHWIILNSWYPFRIWYFDVKPRVSPKLLKIYMYFLTDQYHLSNALKSMRNHLVSTNKDPNGPISVNLHLKFCIEHKHQQCFRSINLLFIIFSKQIFRKWLNHWNNSFNEPSYYEFFSNNTEACTTILYKPTYVASSNVADFLYGWEDVECGVARGYICKYPTGSFTFSLLNAAS